MHPETLRIGPATLMLGDAVERMREIPDGSVDLVLTDLPYCSGATREAGRTSFSKKMVWRRDARWFGSDAMGTPAFVILSRLCALEWQRLLRPGGSVLAFIDKRMDGTLRAAIESADLHFVNEIIWDKVDFTLGSHFRLQHEKVLHLSKGKAVPPLRRDIGDVIQAKSIPSSRRLHPTEKPALLLDTLLDVVGPADGTVLDCFAGSFSTVAVAVAKGRRAIGIERDSAFFDIGHQRIEALVATMPAAAAA